MSNMYITEPNTEGKVLLHTSFGDLDVELWPQQAPKACRNFVQLCLEGYYDNTIFHRIIKDFMIQGGDPTGTGKGGQSIYGAPFQDEFHSRLKFNHRGLLAMANDSAVPNSNTSQFFFTLDACDFLTKKHTIFGKVTGNTIFNLLSVNGMDTDASNNDRPLNPPILKSVEVFWNPFDDLVPRVVVAKKNDQEDARNKKKRERKATKNTKLLSFGDEEEEQEDAKTMKKKRKEKTMMSSHDLLQDTKLNAQVDKELLQKIAETTKERETNKKNKNKSKDGANGSTKMDPRASLKAAVAAAISRSTEPTAPATEEEPTEEQEEEHRGGGENEKEKEEEKAAKKKQRKAAAEATEKERDEYTRLRDELKKDKNSVALLLGEKAKAHEKNKSENDLLTPLQQQRLKFLAKKKTANRSGRQQETLQKLAQFQATLQVVNQDMATGNKRQPKSGSSSAASDTETAAAATTAVGYHGQVLEKENDEEDDGEDDKSWMAAKLKFKKHIDDQFRNSAGQSTDDYLTIDPRDEKTRLGSGRQDRDHRHERRDGEWQRHGERKRDDRHGRRGRDRSRSRSRERGRERERERR